MTFTLAFRNLFHDRVRLIVTLVGILFSIVLVAVQLGMYLGARNVIIGMIEHANADLWVMAHAAKSFEEAQPLPAGTRNTALGTPGVASVAPLVSAFSDWKRPDGGTSLSVIVGSDAADGGLVPWRIVEGTMAALRSPDAVAVDTSYLDNLGINRIGDTAELLGHRVRIAALTQGIRSFTTAPYVFTTIDRARQLLDLPPGAETFDLVRLEPGADLKAVRARLISRLGSVDVLSTPEFVERSLDHWLFGTGAGVALIGGALLGLLVGTVIVAQTLYSSTKDHLAEFATLRALGSSAGYIHRVILAQAGLSAVLGYSLGMMIALTIIAFSDRTPLPIVMTPALAATLFALTLAMCVISAISAIIKVTRIDPAMVFSR